MSGDIGECARPGNFLDIESDRTGRFESLSSTFIGRYFERPGEYEAWNNSERKVDYDGSNGGITEAESGADGFDDLDQEP